MNDIIRGSKIGRNSQSNGSNLELVRHETVTVLVKHETGQDLWSVGRVELPAELDTAQRAEIPEGDDWRVPALRKLLEVRLVAHYTADEVDEIKAQNGSYAQWTNHVFWYI